MPKRRMSRRSTNRRFKRRRTSKQFKKRALRNTARRQVYAFRRFVSGKTTLVGNDTVPSGAGAVNFALSDVPNRSEFTALFDQYKLAGIAYRWVISKDPMVTTVKGYPRLVTVHDFDDSVTPSMTDLYQYPRMREDWFTDSRNTTRWRFIKPARAAVEYESATNSAYRPQWKGFIDCASENAPHYGVKFAYEGLYAGVSIFLQCRYYMVFKNVR